jgi:hypothetical protein
LEKISSLYSLCELNGSQCYDLETISAKNGRTFGEIIVMFDIPYQGCQIFIGTTYQNGKNIPNNHQVHHRAVKWAKWP